MSAPFLPPDIEDGTGGDMTDGSARSDVMDGVEWTTYRTDPWVIVLMLALVAGLLITTILWLRCAG